MDSPRGVLRVAWSQFRSCWPELALTDAAWKLIAFVLLAPMASVLFRVLLAISGKSVLADQDILLFALHPVGLASAVVVGGALLAIIALEQSALLAVLYGRETGCRVDAVAALRFALAHAWPTLRLGARVVGAALLAAAPFLAALGLAYVTLLSDFDINYYLRERPPAFLAALAVGVVVLASLVGVLLRLVAGWLYALPLVLFEEVSPVRALRASRDRARGHRASIVAWVAGWALAVAAVSTAATTVTVWLARAVVPATAGSVVLLALAVGVTLAVWGLVHLAINLLGTTSFAAVLFAAYRHVARHGAIDAERMSPFERDGPGARFTLSRPRLIRWAVVGLLAAVAVGAVAVHSASLADQVQVAAHRGSSKAAPENSMAAFRQAIADGADWVELDVQETADGEVVVFHDSDFMRQAGIDLKIWNATLADLREIDIGSWVSPAFKGERVPTLADVLGACKGSIGVLIELKYYGHNQQLEERVARLVDDRGMASQIAVMSLELDMVRKMKSLRPDWPVGLLMSVSAGDLGKSGADFLAVNAAFADRRFVRRAHLRGEKVYVWTVDDPATMSAMMGRGVDGLITNRPAAARAVLAERARLSPAVRLLVELAGVLGVKPTIGEL